jgi:hypothetical protein
MSRTSDLVWRYWAATAATLALGLAGVDAGLTAAIGLNAVQVLHFVARTRGTTAFMVQVRVLYLGLLLLGLVPGLQILHWLQLAGTTATIAVGYCPLARLLALLPPNRTRRLDRALLRRALLTPPTSGSILDVVNDDTPRSAVPDIQTDQVDARPDRMTSAAPASIST